LYEQRINRSIEENRKQLDDLQAERKRLRQEALEQVCLLSQVPTAGEPPQGNDPAAGAPENGFVFSSEEIERAIDHRSRLVEAGMMQTRADALIKARVYRAVNGKAGGD
jgi:hypothetical protein